MKPAAPPCRIAIVRQRAGSGGVPVLRALRLRPLLFIPLSAEARARPGRRRCQAGGPVPGARPSPPSPLVVVSRTKAPNGNAVWEPPAPQPVPALAKRSVAPARPDGVCACVRARGCGARGAGVRAALGRSPAAGAGTDSPGRARAAPHTRNLSPLPSPAPLPLPSPPAPTSPALSKRADWSTGQKFLWRRLGADVTGRIVPFRDPGGRAHAAGCRFAAGGGSRGRAAARWQKGALSIQVGGRLQQGFHGDSSGSSLKTADQLTPLAQDLITAYWSNK